MRFANDVETGRVVVEIYPPVLAELEAIGRAFTACAVELEAEAGAFNRRVAQGFAEWARQRLPERGSRW